MSCGVFLKSDNGPILTLTYCLICNLSDPFVKNGKKKKKKKKVSFFSRFNNFLPSPLHRLTHINEVSPKTHNYLVQVNLKNPREKNPS